MTLAAAGGLAVADAAQFAATALKQFKLEGGDLPHVADLLAAGAGKAVGDVDDLAQALNQAGLIANAAGFSIEETTGVLAAFADAGLLGSDAGTSLKTAIVALQAPTGKAKDLLKQYGINVYDANGQMLGFADIAGQLETKLGHLDDQTRNAALATIFGTDALRSANVLYAQGAEGIQEYIDQTNDSGYAAKVAADRLNNLAGDVEKLGGSFDTNLIKSGTGANDTLRALVQSATFLLDLVGDIPEPVMNVALAFGVAGTAILLTGGAALVAVPKFAALKQTLNDSGVSLGTFAAKAALAGGAIAIATLAIGFIISTQAEAKAKVDALADSLDKVTLTATKYTREQIKASLAAKNAFGADSALDQAEKLGLNLNTVTDAAMGNAEALAEVSDRLAEVNAMSEESKRAEFGQGGALLAEARAKAVADAIAGESGSLEEAVRVAKQKQEADKGSAASSETASEAYLATAENVETLTSNLQTLIDTINKSNDVGQDAVSTNAAYQQTLADVTDYLAQAQAGVEGYTLGWDKNTVAGSSNQDMLRGLAEDSQAAAEAQLALDGNTDAYLATVTAGNKAMYDQAIAFGASDAEAQAFADTIYAIPSTAEVKLIVDTAAATTKVQDFLNATRGIQIGVGIYANKSLVLADGGAVTGRGGPREDNIPIMGSVGEHMLDAEDVRRMGGQSGVYAFRESLYANNGSPQYAASSGGGGGGTTKTISQTNYLNDTGVAIEIASQRLRASLVGL